MTAALSRIDPRRYRDVMGHLPTGVVVVAGRRPSTGEPAGLVVGTFQSLSLDPALVTFSVALTSNSWPKIRESGRFSASVLASGQHDVCQRLSSKNPDKFHAVDWHESADGNPRITGAHAWIDCQVHHEFECGDHTVVIARVRRLDAGSGEPLVFYRGRLGKYREISA